MRRPLLRIGVGAAGIAFVQPGDQRLVQGLQLLYLLLLFVDQVAQLLRQVFLGGKLDLDVDESPFLFHKFCSCARAGVYYLASILASMKPEPAPVPAPGQVDAPHKYSDLTGVR